MGLQLPCPVAAILTLSFKDTVTYKYGCSDERFNRLGGTPFLFWKTIQEAKAEGMSQLDLGRSDLHNEGSMASKCGWMSRNCCDFARSMSTAGGHNAFLHLC